MLTIRLWLNEPGACGYLRSHGRSHVDYSRKARPCLQVFMHGLASHTACGLGGLLAYVHETTPSTALEVFVYFTIIPMLQKFTITQLVL